jgi:hypothetical protein
MMMQHRIVIHISNDRRFQFRRLHRS